MDTRNWTKQMKCFMFLFKRDYPFFQIHCMLFVDYNYKVLHVLAFEDAVFEF